MLSWVDTPEVVITPEPASVYLSTDNGKSWESFAEGLPKELNARKAFEHNGTIYLTVMNGGVYVLEKGSDTWLKRNSGLPIKGQAAPTIDDRGYDFFPTSIAANGNQLILGTFNHGAFYSDDEGKSWKQATINIDDVVGSLLFTDKKLIAGTHKGIWQSKDRGITWELQCETGFRINALAMHNGELHVARQNGMGILSNNNIEWSDMKTGWAIIELQAQDDELYAITAKQEVYKSKKGKLWESNKFAIKGLPANSLMEALWGGFSPQLPGEMPAGLITKTSRGWIVGTGGGC